MCVCVCLCSFLVGQVSKGDLSTVKCEMLWERWFTYQLSIKGRSFGFSHNVVHTFQISGGWWQPFQCCTHAHTLFLSVRLHACTLLLINHGGVWVWQVSRRCDTASPLSTLCRNINILRRSYPDSSWPPSLFSLLPSSNLITILFWASIQSVLYSCHLSTLTSSTHFIHVLLNHYDMMSLAWFTATYITTYEL